MKCQFSKRNHIRIRPTVFSDVTKKYNKAICDDLGLTAPEVYEAIEG